MFPDVNIEGGIAGGVMYGNAISVDLGQDGLIFVIDRLPKNLTIRGRQRQAVFTGLSQLPLVVYGLTGNAKPSVLKKAVLEAQQEPRDPVEIPADMMPMMVRFKNIEYPQTIEELYAPDLEKELGHDIRFVSATLELTDEPLTKTPENWPDWLKHGNPETLIVSTTMDAVTARSIGNLLGLRIRSFVKP